VLRTLHASLRSNRTSIDWGLAWGDVTVDPWLLDAQPAPTLHRVRPPGNSRGAIVAEGAKAGPLNAYRGAHGRNLGQTRPLRQADATRARQVAGFGRTLGLNRASTAGFAANRTGPPSHLTTQTRSKVRVLATTNDHTTRIRPSTITQVHRSRISSVRMRQQESNRRGCCACDCTVSPHC